MPSPTRDFSTPADPKIAFKDSAKTIEIHYYGEDLLIYNRPMANALKSKFPVGEGTTANMLDAAFSTKEGGTRKTEILEDSRAKLRDLPHKDVPSTTPPPSSTKTSLQNLKDIAAGSPGICANAVTVVGSDKRAGVRDPEPISLGVSIYCSNSWALNAK